MRAIQKIKLQDLPTTTLNLEKVLCVTAELEDNIHYTRHSVHVITNDTLPARTLEVCYNITTKDTTFVTIPDDLDMIYLNSVTPKIDKECVTRHFFYKIY